MKKFWQKVKIGFIAILIFFGVAIVMPGCDLMLYLLQDNTENVDNNTNNNNNNSGNSNTSKGKSQQGG